MKTFEKLAKRIYKDTGVKLINFRRTYAGKNAKSAGGWSWTAIDAENKANDVGSIDTATELLKSKKPLIYKILGWPYSNEIWMDE